jgi:hypothetical protein
VPPRGVGEVRGRRQRLDWDRCRLIGPYMPAVPRVEAIVVLDDGT